MALFPGTPKLESRNCPETVPVGVPGLWELITPDCKVWLRRGLNQTYSPRRDLFNDVSHFQFEGREKVDSRLFVVGSQTGNLTPGPSFAHNLGYRCPNGQGEAIFVIFASRPFQWHQEHLNARCFGPCCRALNIRESRRTPNPQLWKCWDSPPHLAKVGLRHTWRFRDSHLGVPGQKVIRMPLPRSGADILYGGRWWLPPSPGRGESCESEVTRGLF
jgi:hypothetical protein